MKLYIYWVKKDRARVKKQVLFFYFKNHSVKNVCGECINNVKNKSVIIITNSFINEQYVTAVWCILHEIGHFILGHTGGKNELEANEYANKMMEKFRSW